MINFKTSRRALAAVVAAAVASIAPGFPAYAAAAEIVRVQLGAAEGPRAIAVPFAGAGMSMPSLPSIAAPSMGESFFPEAAPSAALAAAPAVLPTHAPLTASVLPAAARLPAAAARPVSAPALPATRSASTPLDSARKGVSSALEAVGKMDSASPSSLNGLGRHLEAALSGAPALTSAADLPAASQRSFGDLVDRGDNLARPAGDLIRQAAEAHSGAAAPLPPAPPARAPQAPRGPFWPKLLASGLALAPAYFLGLPLIAGGAAVLGGLTIAGSLALAVMPFLGESAPKVLRAAPGVVVGALGVAAIVSGFVWPGVFAAVGGWGLTRYGLGKSQIPHYESAESLTAYFGGVAAVAGAALAASGHAGLAAEALRDLAYPISALLFLHLPSWVGEGMVSVFEGAWRGFKGLSRVTFAVRRDTVLLQRLESFSERHWNASKWNAVWLSLIWTPIMLVEAAKWVATVAAGLYVGATQAPVMFAWGASYKLAGKSKATSYFAEAARFVFDRVQNGKAGIFNKAEAKILPLVNSEKLLSRAAGSVALNALLVGWLGYVAVATPLLSLAGLIVAFGRTGAYDAGRHDPSSLKVNTEDSPGAKPTEPTGPTEPTTPGKAPFAPKLIAAALALAPALYFGLPLYLGTIYHAVGILYLALALPLAAMPFMGPRTPRFLKSFAGHALQWNGLLMFFSGHALIMGAIATLGGWGFTRYIAERDGKDGRFDDAAELGAFFGALGASVGLGAAWLGLTGTFGTAALVLAAVLSPFLLMHLPEYVWSGVRGALKEFPKSMRAYAEVLGFWHEDTKFQSNLRKHANFWLQKTYWNGVWLSLIWVPTGVIEAAEYLLAIALGAVTALGRAPYAFVAGALKNAKPEGRAAAFFGGFVNGWSAAAEGSKALFDRMISGLKPAMDEASPVSGRPTVKAVLAFLGARVIQLAWLIGVLAMLVSGASLVVGLIRGARAAFAPKPVAKN
ncbi:MAG: hypothetical protein ACHQ51_10100 [Elusimicrobiota bacterium]